MTVIDVAVGRVHRAVGEQLSSRRAGGVALERTDERMLAQSLAIAELRRLTVDTLAGGADPLTDDAENEVVQTVMDRLFGLGGIQRWLDDPSVSNIHVNGAHNVFIEWRDGTKSRVGSVASSDEELIEMVATIARRIGRSERRWDPANPFLNLQLANGHRLHASQSVSGVPLITIRRHDFSIGALSEVHRRGMVDDALVSFLAAAVKARLNIVVAGGTNSGKTTLLRCLINEIPSHERLITIEDNLELGLERYGDAHPDFASMEARPANTEGVGRVTTDELVTEALRMNPSRVIVGEVRGPECMGMLMAMTQGNEGSMCSVHADSAHVVLSRLGVYAAMHHLTLDDARMQQLISQAIDLVVHVRGPESPGRRVSSIREVTDDFEGTRTRTNEIWRPDDDGFAVPGTPMSHTMMNKVIDHGFDQSLLERRNGWWRR